jgi:hypothetical protein
MVVHGTFREVGGLLGGQIPKFYPPSTEVNLADPPSSKEGIHDLDYGLFHLVGEERPTDRRKGEWVFESLESKVPLVA